MGRAYFPVCRLSIGGRAQIRRIAAWQGRFAETSEAQGTARSPLQAAARNRVRVLSYLALGLRHPTKFSKLRNPGLENPIFRLENANFLLEIQEFE